MSSHFLCVWNSFCVSKTQVVRHKYLKAHINTERLWPDPHCQPAASSFPPPLLFLLLSVSSSCTSSSSLPPLLFLSSSSPLAVYYCELWQDDVGLFPPRFWGRTPSRPSRCLQLITTGADLWGCVSQTQDAEPELPSVMSLPLLLVFCTANLALLALLAHVLVSLSF